MSRGALALLAVLSGLLLSASAHAQYIYLDTNNDGVHTDADVVPASGEVVADVWLVTNETRDGRPVACDLGNGPLDLSSYVVNLRASSGTVVWGAFTNLMSGFQPLAVGRDSVDFEAGAFDVVFRAAGRYRLASIQFTVASGAPRIDFVPESRYLVGPTSFGSHCGGLEYDNTQKLGLDWFDADGLDPASPNRAPVLEPVDDLVLDENTIALRHIAANDPDGDDLALTFQGLPPYSHLSVAPATAGHIEADVTFAPTYSSWTGYPSSPVSVEVRDGIHVRQISFRVALRNVNRSPVIAPVTDVTMDVGSSTQVRIFAFDPDGDDGPPALALVEGPNFATFANGIVSLRPGLDAGRYSVRITASDRFSAQTTLSFQVTVTDSGLHTPPVFEPIGDMWVSEGEAQHLLVQARASDGDTVSVRLLQAPAYVFFRPTDQPGLGLADIWLTPGVHGAGVDTVRLEAFTGLYRTTAEFHVHVQNTPFPPTLEAAIGCVEPGGRGVASFVVYAPELDSVRVTCSGLPPWARVSRSDVGVPFGNYSNPGILLLSMAPAPEERPSSAEITVYLSQGTPSEMSWPATLVVSDYDQCISPVEWLGDPPIPVAGVASSAVAGAAVPLQALSTPGVSDSTYRWTFGDGHAALGAYVSHVYAEGGTYRAIVRASNHPLSRDSVDVVVASAYPARAFQAEGASGIRVTHDNDLCLELEPSSGGYRFETFDLATVWLWADRGSGADSIPAASTEWILDESGNRIGIHACFARAVLGPWFLGVRGDVTLQGRLQGRLADGARVRAPVSLELVGHAWDPRTVVMRPNPLHPSGTLSFENPSRGRVSVRIYDAAGRLVRTLHDGVLGVGPIDVPFNGRGSRGEVLRSGVYFYRIESAGRVRSGRLAIVR